MTQRPYLRPPPFATRRGLACARSPTAASSSARSVVAAKLPITRDKPRHLRSHRTHRICQVAHLVEVGANAARLGLSSAQCVRPITVGFYAIDSPRGKSISLGSGNSIVAQTDGYTVSICSRVLSSWLNRVA